MPLTATPDDQARLLELQALDTRLSQLDHRVKRLPETAALTELTGEAEQLRVRHGAQAGEVEDARTELTRVESDVKIVEARIARDSERLQRSSSVKDVAGLESELTGLRRRLDELEEIELAVMERLEQLEGVAAATEREQGTLRQRIEETGRERDAAMAEITAARSDAVGDRTALAGRLPAELVALYERQRARYGFGASLLRGGVSSASGVRLLENELAVVRAAADDAVLICPDSQAILVRTSESGL